MFLQVPHEPSLVLLRPAIDDPRASHVLNMPGNNAPAEPDVVKVAALELLVGEGLFHLDAVFLYFGAQVLVGVLDVDELHEEVGAVLLDHHSVETLFYLTGLVEQADLLHVHVIFVIVVVIVTLYMVIVIIVTLYTITIVTYIIIVTLYVVVTLWP